MTDAMFSKYEAGCETNGLEPRAPLLVDRLPIRRLELGLFRMEPAFSCLPLRDGDAVQDALHGRGQTAETDEGDLGRNAVGFWRSISLRDEKVLGLRKDVAEDGDGVAELQAQVGEHLASQRLLHRQSPLQNIDLFPNVHRLVSLIGRAIKAAFGKRVD